MKEKPLVSIVVPCYNAAKYLAACVNSVVAQDYENWECILINDGSRDETLEILSEFAAQNPKLKVFTQENAGLSSTRNRGIESAAGDLLFFLDSDDVLSTDALHILVSAYENNDIVSGITVNSTFTAHKIMKVSHLLHPKEGDVTFINDDFEVLIRTMESGLSPVAQNRLYRKEFLDKNDLRFRPGILHEDELWFFETMLVAQNVKFVNKETYFYRIDNQGSITQNVSDRNLDSYIKVMEEIVQKYTRNPRFVTVASWYAVYIKKIFLHFAIREESKLSSGIFERLESALKANYVTLEGKQLLSFNNSVYYRTLNTLSLQPFPIIKKYFFKNPVNSLRKIKRVLQIRQLQK